MSESFTNLQPFTRLYLDLSKIMKTVVEWMECAPWLTLIKLAILRTDDAEPFPKQAQNVLFGLFDRWWFAQCDLKHHHFFRCEFMKTFHVLAI